MGSVDSSQMLLTGPARDHCPDSDVVFPGRGSACACPRGGARRRRGCDCLQNSERAQDQTIVLPMFPELTDAEQEVVTSALRRACAE